MWFVGQILGINRRRRLVVPKAARAAIPQWSVSAAAAIVTRPGSRRAGGTVDGASDSILPVDVLLESALRSDAPNRPITFDIRRDYGVVITAYAAPSC